MPFWLFGGRRAAAAEEANKGEPCAILPIVENTISKKLTAVLEDARWRWVCCPSDITRIGGIARIEVLCTDNGSQYVDVCLSVKDNELQGLTLFRVTVCEFGKAESSVPKMSVEKEKPATAVIDDGAVYTSLITSKPTNEDDVTKWFNIVLIGTLRDLIADLHIKGEQSLVIKECGQVCVEGKEAAEFGELPERTHWELITGKLAEEGLFSEEQDEGLFVSWAC